MTTKDILAEMVNAAVDGNDESIEELILMAGDAPEPGVETGLIEHKPTKDAPYAVQIGDVESSGHRFVWDTQTGDRSIIPTYLLGSQLSKLRDDGTRYFTTKKPDFDPPRGQYPCILHSTHPDRAYHDTLGLPVCPAGNLRSPMDVRTHAQHRHRSEWGILEENRRQAVETEEREVRKATIAAFARQSEPAPVAQESVPVAPEPPTQTVVERESTYDTDDLSTTTIHTCEKCGKVLHAKRGGMRIKISWHNRKVHA